MWQDKNYQHKLLAGSPSFFNDNFNPKIKKISTQSLSFKKRKKSNSKV